MKPKRTRGHCLRTWEDHHSVFFSRQVANIDRHKVEKTKVVDVAVQYKGWVMPACRRQWWVTISTVAAAAQTAIWSLQWDQSSSQPRWCRLNIHIRQHALQSSNKPTNDEAYNVNLPVNSAVFVSPCSKLHIILLLALDIEDHGSVIRIFSLSVEQADD